MARCRGRLGASPRGIIGRGLLCCAMLAATTSAEALEVSGGVSLGGVLAGSKPRFAVTPHAGVAWRMESGLLVAAHEMLSILPATDQYGVGVYNRISGVLGYATEKVNFSVGPSLSIFYGTKCQDGSVPSAHDPLQRRR